MERLRLLNYSIVTFQFPRTVWPIYVFWCLISSIDSFIFDFFGAWVCMRNIGIVNPTLNITNIAGLCLQMGWSVVLIVRHGKGNGFMCNLAERKSAVSVYSMTTGNLMGLAVTTPRSRIMTATYQRHGMY